MKKRTIRTLLVDDFQSFRQWVAAKLQSQDGRFLVAGEASDGRGAIQRAQELAPDLILLDVGLPDMNGIEVEKRIRAVVPLAKILFLSACTDSEVVQCALSNGAKGYILKFEAERELLPAINAVSRGSTFVSRRLTRRRGTVRPILISPQAPRDYESV